MQVKVVGRHMTVTDPTRAYAEEKFGRIAKIYDAEPIVAEVVLDVRKNRSRPDRFTCRGNRPAERARGPRRGDLDRHARRNRSGGRQGRDADAQVQDEGHRSSQPRTSQSPRRRRATREIEEEEPAAEVVRVKTVDAKPMTEEEAMLQLELLGHDFFVFRHAEHRDRQRALPPKRRRLRADSAPRVARSQARRRTLNRESALRALSLVQVDIALTQSLE